MSSSCAPGSPTGRRPGGMAFCLACLILAGHSAWAQDLYIVNGLVYPVTSAPAVTDIAIRDGRILAVGPQLGPGPEDTVFDAAGLVVTPGLVDFETHVGLVEIWAVDESRDNDAGDPDEIRAGFRAADSINPQSELIRVTRRGGVTSVVSHPSGGLIAGQSVWLDLAGERAGDMVVLAPVSMDIQAGAAGASSVGGSRGSAILRFRELFADVAAYRAAPGRYQENRMRPLSVSLVDLEAMEPVLDGELAIFVAVHRQSDILQMVELAGEYGLRLIVGGGAEAWCVAEELAAGRIPVVINPFRNAPDTFEQLRSREDAAAILDQAGVPVILTTEESHNVRNLRQIAGNAVRAGMSWDSALAAVTLRPAQAAGLGDLYGSIEPGKMANLTVWSGDPFELSSLVRAVFIRGRQVSLESRQTRLFERYREIR